MWPLTRERRHQLQPLEKRFERLKYLRVQDRMALAENNGQVQTDEMQILTTAAMPMAMSNAVIRYQEVEKSNDCWSLGM